jgi:uncharacterized protein with von Willebrand factor type A (vWA) domain
MSARPLETIAGFAAHLRDHGLTVGIAEHRSMVRAALSVRVEESQRLQAGWRSIVCHSPAQWRKYPDLFETYWFPHRLKGSVRTEGRMKPRRDLRQIVADLQRAANGRADSKGAPDSSLSGDAEDESGHPGQHAQGGASRAEALCKREFSRWLPQDMARLERLVETIAQRMRRHLLRRLQREARGHRLDMRSTLRRSLRTAGEPFVPEWLRRRRERPRLFVLVDVSRSMETYAQLFLRIARAFVAVLGARVFVFHTRLAEVTALLARDSARVQEKINAVTAGFGGGTRIATSLADFVHGYARNTLSRSARLLVLSDGFDSDPPEQLAEQLARIRRRDAKIYWLHPTRHAPQSSALQLSRGLISGFAPVHNLETLARLRDLID